MTLARKFVAEALGTGLLVAAVVGSGVMAQRLTTDTALALLANSLATGAVLVVLITIFANLPGAQFNPLITLVFTLRDEMRLALAFAYVVMQVLGGLLGVMLAHAMFDLPLLQVALTVRSGMGQWIAEGVASFALVLAVLGAIRAKANVAIIVACYITAAYRFTASTSFANPAVALARAFTDTFAGIRPADLPSFLLAECVGALVAAGLGGWLFGRDIRHYGAERVSATISAPYCACPANPFVVSP